MNKFPGNLFEVFSVAARLLMRFLAGAIGLLAGSAQADREDREDREDDEASDPAQGGVFNYRTGKLDDGTDPVGWYERD